MIKIRAEIQIEGREPHTENLPVSSLETAEEEIKAMVDRFNAILRPDEKPRKFIRIIPGEEKKLHNWKKISFITQQDSQGFYDLYECEQCGLRFKRRRLDSKPPQTECYPERTCKECQKVFASEKNLERHNKRKHSEEEG